MTITVFGGTGQVGSLLVDELVARGEEPCVVTRSADRAASLPAGVRGVVADLDHPASLGPALTGADRVFLLVPNSPTEAHRALTALSTILDASPERIVYLSADLAARAPLVPHAGPKLGVEAALRACGTDYTILRPTYFAQNDLLLRAALLGGVYPVPLGNSPVARVDARDVALAAAGALVDGTASHQTVLLSSTDQPGGDESAALWSEALGRPVAWPGVRAADWSAMVADTMPAWLVCDLTVMYRHFEELGHPVSLDELDAQRALLPEPRSYRTFVEETALQWANEEAK